MAADGAASTIDSAGVSYTSHGATYWCTGLSAAQLAAAVQAAQRKAKANLAEWERRLGPLTISDDNVEEARPAAATEGLELVPSSNAVGFKGVSKIRGRYMATVWENGKQRYLGIFATPEEAALCYVRHIGAARAAAEAAEARGEGLQPLTAPEATAAAAAEGLELVPSLSSATGFKGVRKHLHGKYVAQATEDGKNRHLGIFATPEEAALCYARRVKAPRAAAEAAEARGEGPQPLTAAEARAAAAAEGLELVPSSNAVGFKGVAINRGRYLAHVWEDGKLHHLGSFTTPEQAALCYAQHTAKNTARSHQRGKKRQRELHQNAREQQPSSHDLGSWRAPRLTQVGEVETVIIDRFVFRCCAVRATAE